MKISELSAETGVSVPSIKYYLREGLLPAGVAVATNQADYGEAHIRRLRLIRALIDVGELPVASVRNVLAAVDSERTSLHDAFGSVMHSLDAGSHVVDADVDAAVVEVRRWIRHRKWAVEATAPATRMLAELIVTLRRFGFPAQMNEFDRYADQIFPSCEFGVEYARAMPDRTVAVETMVVGTVVYERAFAEIRRLALEAASARAHVRARATRPRGTIRRSGVAPVLRGPIGRDAPG